MVFCQYGLCRRKFDDGPEELHNVQGNVDDLGFLFGDIYHELENFSVGEVLAPETVDRAPLELVGLLHNLSDCLRNIPHVHRLEQRPAVVDHRHEGAAPGDAREPVEEAVLRSKKLGRSQDGGPRIGLFDRILAVKLGPGPSRLGVFLRGEARDVDQIIHLHLGAELGNGAGNIHVRLLVAVVSFVEKRRELSGGICGEGLGFVVFPHEINDHVGV
mmetsp:Transcript_44173/g.86681  ORF Transcript_44173/g.86681 Transcript_44173/m.86681 type:complete len:216 (-) Transcript_44173:400-1047(-)